MSTLATRGEFFNFWFWIPLFRILGNWKPFVKIWAIWFIKFLYQVRLTFGSSPFCNCAVFVFRSSFVPLALHDIKLLCYCPCWLEFCFCSCSLSSLICISMLSLFTTLMLWFRFGLLLLLRLVSSSSGLKIGNVIIGNPVNLLIGIISICSYLPGIILLRSNSNLYSLVIISDDSTCWMSFLNDPGPLDMTC